MIQCKVITISSECEVDFIGTKLTELTNDWIKENDNMIYNISSITTHLTDRLAMATIIYSI